MRGLNGCDRSPQLQLEEQAGATWNEETSHGPGETGSLRELGALGSGRTGAVRKEMLGLPAHEGTTDLSGQNSL